MTTTEVGTREDASAGKADLQAAEELLDLIRVGEANAVGVADLSRDSGYSQRRVKALIRLLRHNGWPICSTSGNGYFFPASRQEAEHTKAYFAKIIESHEQTLRAIQRGLSTLFAGIE
ncbi:MAG TPA: hypothetical protein VNS09_20360 [Solirubrobacter sp.]|nr:hypothetical protein [Solirubrobacter sp.]